jgi:hypothetical protein
MDSIATFMPIRHRRHRHRRHRLAFTAPPQQPREHAERSESSRENTPRDPMPRDANQSRSPPPARARRMSPGSASRVATTEREALRYAKHESGVRCVGGVPGVSPESGHGCASASDAAYNLHVTHSVSEHLVSSVSLSAVVGSFFSKRLAPPTSDAPTPQGKVA